MKLKKEVSRLDLNFERLPRFKGHAMKLLELLPEWAAAHEVSRDAIIDQIYTAHAWANANPKKAPKKQITRFLWSWMASAKRYGNLKTPMRPTIKPPDPVENYDMTPEEMIEIRQANMRRRHV